MLLRCIYRTISCGRNQLCFQRLFQHLTFPANMYIPIHAAFIELLQLKFCMVFPCILTTDAPPPVDRYMALNALS